MILMGRELPHSGSGNGTQGAQSAPGAAHAPPRLNAGTRITELLKCPRENFPLLREIAIGHRDAAVRWQCVCALVSLGNEAADALTLILRESADSDVRARADRALRPITVILGALVMTGTAFGILRREDVKVALLHRHARADWGRSLP